MDPILSALDKLREELSRAIAAQKFRQTFGSSPVPVLTDRFTHADPEDVRVSVHRLMSGDPERVLSLNLSNTDAAEACAHLNQDAVNALAQYLDAHRTDGPTADPEPVTSPARCESVSPGMERFAYRCELNTGHTMTHRYCQHEWTDTGWPLEADAAKCPWRFQSLGPVRQCDLTAGEHVMHSDGLLTWGENGPGAYSSDPDLGLSSDSPEGRVCALCDEMDAKGERTDG